MKPTQCPKCQSDWDGGSILETFIKQRDEGWSVWEGMTDADIIDFVNESYSPPQRWGRQIHVTLNSWPYHNETFVKCPDCNAYFNHESMAEVEIDTTP